MRIFFFLSLLLILTACAGEPDKLAQPLLPVYSGPQDPGDEVMRAAVADFLVASGAPQASDYNFSRYDLDNDGRRDALVLFKSPYGYWCDMHGCTMLVLKASDAGFNLVNAIQPVRGPLYISENTGSNGWKDLVLHVSGRWDKAKDVAMAYNGSQYPSNPASLPAYPKGERTDYTRIFQ